MQISSVPHTLRALQKQYDHQRRCTALCSQQRARIPAVAALTLLLVFASVTTGCDKGDEPSSVPPKSASTQGNTVSTQTNEESGRAVPPHLARLDFDGRANFLLVDDIDRDGKPDLVLTSHGGNYSQVFRQTAPRKFEGLERITAVGFHPNEFSVLSSEPPLYVSSAEGESEMRVFAFDDGRSARMIASRPLNRPRFATAFSWPDYGAGMAVVPYSGNDLTLLFGFTPESGNWGDELTLEVSPKVIHFPSQVAAADIDGDSVDELLFTIPKPDILAVVRRPEVPSELKAEVLWALPKRGTYEFVIPADIDGADGIDLLVLGHPSSHVEVLLNDGRGGFRAEEIKTTGGGAVHGAFAVDKDGARYLLLAEPQEFVLKELAPKGTDVVWEATASNGGRMASIRVALTDLDVDGWLDAVIIRNGNVFNNAILYGPLKEHFSDLAIAATEQFYREEVKK